MKNLTTQGFILIDVDATSLNNAGKDTKSNDNNVMATKTISKNGRTYVYASGQAWRYWWRETLKKDFDWNISPIVRDDAKNQAFTATNPLIYEDDDIFGYMKAATEDKLDSEGKPALDKKGKKEKGDDISVTRVSPLKNSAIISVAAVTPVRHQSGAFRHEGNPVPFKDQDYSATMKGMFSLDLEMVGTFSSYNKSGFKNITQQMRDEILKAGATEVVDTHLRGANGEPHKLVRLPKDKRVKRITDTIGALKVLSGGAVQTRKMTDVTPKFIILATLASGNHPFSHIVNNKGEYDEYFNLNTEGIVEVLEDYKDQLQGKVFIGMRSGFLSEYEEQKMKKLVEQFPQLLEVLSVNKAIDKYIEQVKTQIS